LQNYQSQVLSGYELSQFSLLGTTEKLAEFLEKMHALFSELNLINPDLQLPSLPAVNVTPKKPSPVYGSAFLKAFGNFHSADYDLYRAISDQSCEISASRGE